MTGEETRFTADNAREMAARSVEARRAQAERRRALRERDPDVMRDEGRRRAEALIVEAQDVDLGLLSRAIAVDLLRRSQAVDLPPRDVAALASAAKTFHAIARLEEGKPTAITEPLTENDRLARLAELRHRADERRRTRIADGPLRIVGTPDAEPVP
jgi:hypothetical protein